MRLKVKPNPLKGAFKDTSYSDCALRAIGVLFDLNKWGVLLAMKSVGWDPKKDEDGVTLEQCHQVVRMLCKLQNKQCKYTRVRKRITIEQFIQEHRVGVFLLNYSIHLGVYKDGIFIDDWNPKQWPLEGYWEIRSQLDWYSIAA